MQVIGTVRKVIAEKGFGFLADDRGVDYFFHRSACRGGDFDRIRVGDRVSFTQSSGPKGRRAEDIRTS